MDAQMTSLIPPVKRPAKPRARIALETPRTTQKKNSYGEAPPEVLVWNRSGC